MEDNTGKGTEIRRPLLEARGEKMKALLEWRGREVCVEKPQKQNGAVLGADYMGRGGSKIGTAWDHSQLSGGKGVTLSWRWR